MNPPAPPAAKGEAPPARASVRDPAVAAEVDRHLANRVTLTYEQHLGLPSCFGDTEYLVKAVRGVEP